MGRYIFNPFEVIYLGFSYWKCGSSKPDFFFLLNKIYFSSHSDFQKRGGFTGYAYPYFFIYILTIYYPNTAALSSVPSAQCLLRGATIHNYNTELFARLARPSDHISLKIQRAFPKASVDHTFASLKSLKNETVPQRDKCCQWTMYSFWDPSSSTVVSFEQEKFHKYKHKTLEIIF